MKLTTARSLKVDDLPVELSEFLHLGEGRLVYNPRTASARTFEEDIGTIWTLGSDGTIVRDDDPFASLQDAVEEHVQEGQEIAQELQEQACDVAELQDSLDGVVAFRKQAGPLLPDSEQRPSGLALEFEKKQVPYLVVTDSNGKSYQVYRPKGDDTAVVRPLVVKTEAGEPEVVNLNHWENELGHYEVHAKAEGMRFVANLVSLGFVKTAPPKNVKDPAKWKDAEEAVKKEYGGVEDHYGADDEQIDVYLAETHPTDTGKIFRIIQNKENGEYDEDKFMTGFDDADSAVAAYKAHIPEDRYGGVEPMTTDQFKQRFLGAKTASTPGHWVEYGTCGHVISQCRCGAPSKEQRYSTIPCEDCQGSSNMKEPVMASRPVVAIEEPVRTQLDYGEAQQHVDELQRVVDEHKSQGDQLRHEVGNNAEDTANLIDQFMGKDSVRTAASGLMTADEFAKTQTDNPKLIAMFDSVYGIREDIEVHTAAEWQPEWDHFYSRRHDYFDNPKDADEWEKDAMKKQAKTRFIADGKGNATCEDCGSTELLSSYSLGGVPEDELQFGTCPHCGEGGMVIRQSSEDAEPRDEFWTEGSKIAAKDIDEVPLAVGDRVEMSQPSMKDMLPDGSGSVQGTIEAIDENGYINVKWDDGDDSNNLTVEEDLRKLGAKENPAKPFPNAEGFWPEMERQYADDLRLTEVKKGEEVMSPNGPGKVEDIWGDGKYTLVRLDSSGEMKPYNVDRLRKKEAVIKLAESFEPGTIVQLKPEFGKKGVVLYATPYADLMISWSNGMNQRVNPELLQKTSQKVTAAKLAALLRTAEEEKDDLAEGLEEPEVEEADAADQLSMLNNKPPGIGGPPQINVIVTNPDDLEDVMSLLNELDEHEESSPGETAEMEGNMADQIIPAPPEDGGTVTTIPEEDQDTHKEVEGMFDEVIRLHPGMRPMTTAEVDDYLADSDDSLKKDMSSPDLEEMSQELRSKVNPDSGDLQERIQEFNENDQDIQDALADLAEGVSDLQEQMECGREALQGEDPNDTLAIELIVPVQENMISPPEIAQVNAQRKTANRRVIAREFIYDRGWFKDLTGRPFYGFPNMDDVVTNQETGEKGHVSTGGSSPGSAMFHPLGSDQESAIPIPLHHPGESAAKKRQAATVFGRSVKTAADASTEIVPPEARSDNKSNQTEVKQDFKDDLEELEREYAGGTVNHEADPIDVVTAAIDTDGKSPEAWWDGMSEEDRIQLIKIRHPWFDGQKGYQKRTWNELKSPMIEKEITWEFDKSHGEGIKEAAVHGACPVCGNAYEECTCADAKKASLKLSYVRPVGSEWGVYSKDGKLLGKHKTKEDATNQLRAIEVNKHGISSVEVLASTFNLQTLIDGLLKRKPYLQAKWDAKFKTARGKGGYPGGVNPPSWVPWSLRDIWRAATERVLENEGGNPDDPESVQAVLGDNPYEKIVPVYKSLMEKHAPDSPVSLSPSVDPTRPAHRVPPPSPKAVSMEGYDPLVAALQ